MAAPDDLTPEDAVARVFSAQSGHAPGPLGVAVSGGGDSLALLIAAQGVAAGRKSSVHAVTVNHGLRPEAAEEAARVAAICTARGIPHDILSLSLSDGPNLQARAREARYAALGAWARAEGLPCMLVGHTRDDVAESLVMRLRRGVGLQGLAAMTDGWDDAAGTIFARPFLELSRASLRRYLDDHGVTPIEDPSNEDNRFERVEVRKALATLGWSDAALARSARHLALASQSYDARLDEIFERFFTVAGGDLTLGTEAARAFERDEPDSFRRLILAGLWWIGGAPTPRTGEQARLIRLIQDPDTPGLTLAGCRVVLKRDTIRIFREFSACPPPVPLGTLWDRRWRVTGPDTGDLRVGALGDDIRDTPAATGGRPRAALRTDPAVRRNGVLVSAPTAGLANGYDARVEGSPRAAFRHRRRFFN